MSIIDSATNAVTSAQNVLTNIGPASGLASLANSIGGAFGAVGAFLKKLPGVKLPLPNPLFNYATYDYVIGLGCLSANECNYPDSTYKSGKPVALICKSANADPTNRVKTPYGQFDFFIDDLVIDSTIGNEQGSENTNATNLSFTVTEPFSMGMFIIACQTLAQKLGHDNWREAPFILTLEFRGNTETGSMVNVPYTSRYIPFNFQDMNMRVTEKGSVYQCTGMPVNQAALTDANSLFKSDTSAKGKTVQEVLQTGEKSLQTVINQKLKDIAKNNNIPVPDEVIIMFPQDTSSAGSAAAASNSSAPSSATANPTETADAGSLFQKLGVSRSSMNQTLVQQAADCNVLGKADMGFDKGRKADAPVGKDNQVYDSALKVNVRGNNTSDPKESDFKFAQDTSIPNAINQVLIASNFAKETFDASRLSPEGYRGWWRIDTQVYLLQSKENMKVTGSNPKILVYRVVPYGVHASRLMPPNTKAPGFENLSGQIVKEYNYLYTGKNVDVLKFDIQINNGFSTILAADGITKSQDIQQSAQQGAAADPVSKPSLLGVGNAPGTTPGSSPTTVKYIGTNTSSDKKGGGGAEDEGTRAARLFQDALSSINDMYDLSMTILGDPYFIAQSGMGNYTSTQTQYTNLNSDGTVNYQNGEVDIKVNFRTPIDINQTTGLYDFGSKSAPVTQFSGFYCVTSVKSTFKGGEFKQILEGFRRPQQENLFAATPDTTFNLSTAKVDKSDPYGYGD